MRDHLRLDCPAPATARPLLTWALALFLAGVLATLLAQSALGALLSTSRPSPDLLVEGSAARAALMVEARSADAGMAEQWDRAGSTSPSSTDPAPATDDTLPGRDVASVLTTRNGSPARPDPAAVVAIIRNAFRERGLDADRAIAIARCESGLRRDAVGDGGQSVGLFQFRLATFAAAARRLYGRDVGDLRADPVASSMVAAAKIATDGDWGAWSCSRSMP